MLRWPRVDSAHPISRSSPRSAPRWPRRSNSSSPATIPARMRSGITPWMKSAMPSAPMARPRYICEAGSLRIQSCPKELARPNCEHACLTAGHAGTTRAKTPTRCLSSLSLTIAAVSVSRSSRYWLSRFLAALSAPEAVAFLPFPLQLSAR